jgi:hypothetical protein
MTDLPDDELASTYLDGEATPDERARVEGDPELSALVDRMRRARDELVVDYPSQSMKDETVRAAVRAITVVDLRAERARRRLQLVSVAAAVLAVIGILGALVSLASSSSDKKASSAAASAPPSTALNPTAAEGGAATATADSANGFLGTFSDRGQLANAVQNAVQSAANRDQAALAGSPTPFSTSGTRCAVSLPPDAVEEVVVASAILDGRAVQVDAYRVTDGSLWIIVTNVDGCTEAFTQSQ